MILRRFALAGACVAAIAATVALGQSTPRPGQPGVRAMAPIADSPSWGPSERTRPGPAFLSSADHVLFTRADDAATHLDWGAARALAAQGSDRTARELMEWRYALDDHGDAGFEQIVAVLAAHPDWPRREGLFARAEKTMPVTMAPRAVLDWFAAHPPVTGYGQVRMGEALVATGARDKGIALVRKGWIEGSFDLNDEFAITGRDGEWLGPETQAARLDRLLWGDDLSAARRQLDRTSGEARTLGEARVKLKANLASAERVMDSLPSSLRDEPALIYERARSLRRAGHDLDAWAVMARAPHRLANPERWWSERHIMARDALKAHQYQRAYDLVVHHGLTSGSDFVDAEFLVGWIALRFLREPAIAERHFRTLTEKANYPISRARGHYWLGRAQEAQGKTAHAVASYRTAAKESGTFYGQLAQARIEDHPILHVSDAGGAIGEARTALASDGRVRVLRITADLGQKDLLRSFANQIARDNPDPSRLKALAALMLELGDRAGSVRIAKQASYGGAMLLSFLHPVIALPPFPGAGTGPEPALVHGLIRQETEFDPEAISSAGARGLMQLMASSARAAASRYGLPYDFGALTTDPSYNTKLGMGEFQTYLDNFNGSYVLSIASYNAGQNRIRQWIDTYGDPRKPNVDPVDWIELIPFGETRNYVQRVLENTEVYRNRLAGGDRPLMILTDLYRPATPDVSMLHHSGPIAEDGGPSTSPSAAPRPRAKPRLRRGTQH